MTIYDTLCIGGGGMKGIILLGAIQSALDANIINNEIKNYIGTSIGAVICYLLVIGYTPAEILSYLLNNKILEKIPPFNIFSILDGEGMISFTHIQETLEKMTLEKAGKFHTMKSVEEKFGKKLFFTTFNITKQQTEYISTETYPDLPCIVGIRMSCNVPFLFDKYLYDGNYYIDGGIVENFSIIKAEQITMSKVLGFHVFKELSIPKTHTFYEYIFTIFSIPITELVKYQIANKTEKSHIIKISDNHRFLFDFKASGKDILEMFSTGFLNFKKEYYILEKTISP